MGTFIDRTHETQVPFEVIASKTDARFMQDIRKAVWSIPYVSVAFFPSLKHNFIAYRSSKVSDWIFEIHQLWQSGFSRVYSNSWCSCRFEAEFIKIGQSSHKMYSNNILNFQESTTILNAYTKSLETNWMDHVSIASVCTQSNSFKYCYVIPIIQFCSLLIGFKHSNPI